jgi:acetyl-CoA acyltransferase 1
MASSSQRVARIAGHLAASSASTSRDDDVVIVSAVRTPVCKAKRGGLATTAPDVLLAQALAGAVARARVRPDFLQDVSVGNVLQPGGGAIMARMAQFEAGFPETVPVASVNRQCSSGLQAIANIYGAIKAGVIDAGIGAGVESMSFNSMTDATPVVDFDAVGECPLARDCLVPMGTTSENVAAKYGVSRADQDAFAARSHERAAAAQARGEFRDEIIPTRTKEGVLVEADDGVRADTTVAGLSKLRPAFQEGGTTTAGNSSQVSDGAAAVVLVRRRVAERLGLPILGVMRSYTVVGVPPALMGVGPGYAIPAAVAAAGLKMDDIDVFEINEAFASQCLWSIRHLGLEKDLAKGRVNPLGGAIALGHPLGCTGARQTATLLHYLRRHGKRYGVVSMCIGTGMGAAAVYEAE